MKRICALTVVAFAAAAISVASANAEDNPGTGKKRLPANPIEAISNGLKLWADPVEPADFVKRSRPAEDKLQYIPTGTPRPQPDGRVLSGDEIRAKEAELDAMRARHDKVVGRKAPEQVYRSAAGDPKAKTVAAVQKTRAR